MKPAPGWILFGASLLGACSTQREHWNPRDDVPQLVVPEKFQAADSSFSTQQEAPPSGWIANFGDPRLTALVLEALRHSPDVEQAAARADLARAQVRRANAAFRPVLGAYAEAGRGDLVNPGTEATRFEFGLRASWEPDVWGRLSNARRAAILDDESARADLIAASHSLAAATAQAWFSALAAKKRVEVDERSLVQRERVERITRAHYEAGEQPGGDVDVAHGQTEGARQLAHQSRGALRLSLLALESLLGRYPSGELEASGEWVALPPPPPLGLPSQMLERRPDVVAAERAVAAAFERVAGAEKASLPQITLTAEGGYANDELRHLTDPSNVIWDLAAGLLAPLYAGGRLRAEVESAQAQRRGALAIYLSVARNAFFEVESALTQEATLRERETALAAAALHLGRAALRAEERYVQGEATILELDQIHTQLYQSERELVAVRADFVLQRVALHLALGGSFEVQP